MNNVNYITNLFIRGIFLNIATIIQDITKTIKLKQGIKKEGFREIELIPNTS